jgi:hypothetical protein
MDQKVKTYKQAWKRRIKRLYDRKAKQRHFAVNDIVYLFNPAMKVGLTKKFRQVWSGPYRITRRISEWNYEIMSQDGRKWVVHVNRIKIHFTKTSEGKTQSRAPRTSPEKGNEAPSCWWTRREWDKVLSVRAGVLKGCASAHQCAAKFLNCAARKGIGKVRIHKKVLCITYLSSVTY